MTEPIYFTVEQASRWLTCTQPVDLEILKQLGRDCSMLARIRNVAWVDVPVHGRRWASERGYTSELIREVFAANPNTKDYIPK